MKRYRELIIILLCISLAITCIRLHNNSVTLTGVEGELFKTVAHIDLSNRKDLELVYTDVENDIAYYRYLDTLRNVEVGETVYLYDNTECSITYTDAYGFAIKGDIKILEGLSGTSIRNSNGEQIGCVSRLMNPDEIYCIWS